MHTALPFARMVGSPLNLVQAELSRVRNAFPERTDLLCSKRALCGLKDDSCPYTLSLASFNGHQERNILADKLKYSNSFAAVLKRYNVAKSAKCAHNLAVSTDFVSAFDRFLTRDTLGSS